MYRHKDSVAELKSIKERPQHDDDEGIYLLKNSLTVNKKAKKSILLRQAYYVLPLTCFTYVAFEIWIHISSNTVCNFAHISQPWVWISTFAVSIWFAIHMIYMLIMIRHQSEKRNAEAVAAYWGSFAIAGMAGSSGWLTLLVFNKQNFCVDYFGVTSRAAQWPEWITTVPLILYVAVSCDSSKTHLHIADILLVSCMIIAISLGYLLNYRIQNLGFNVVLIILSCFATVSCAFLAVSAQKQLEDQIRLAEDYQDFHWAEVTIEPAIPGSYNTLEDQTESNVTSPSGSNKELSVMLVGEISSSNPRYAQHQIASKHSFVNPENKKLTVRLKKQDVENQYQQLQLVLKKRNLGIICIYGLPLFPAIYFLTVSKIISDDLSMVLMIVAGCIAKSIINYLLVAGHISLYEDEKTNFSRTAQNLQRKLSEQRKVMKMVTDSYYNQQKNLKLNSSSAV